MAGPPSLLSSISELGSSLEFVRIMLNVRLRVPLSLSALAITFTGPLSRVIVPKWFILLGSFMTIVATILLPFASTPDTYWRFVFPAFVIGSAGMQLIYTHAKYVLFSSSSTSPIDT